MRTRRSVLASLVSTPFLGALTRRAAARQASPTPYGAQVIVLSDSSPHLSVIDAASLQVATTTDIPDFTSWTWNDDNNHFDGQNLWLGMRNPDTDDVAVITLDLNTLEVTHRIPLDTDTMTLYIGKATADGILNVAKMGSGQVVAIDTLAFAVLHVWSVPVNGDVVCDADVSTDARGGERFVYPTRKGDTVVTLDPRTGETVKEIASPHGATPLMLTTGRDGRIWVQESSSNTNAVYDPDLNLLKRFPTGKGPIVNTFSPDGKLSYIGHGGDTIVQVIDTATFEEVRRLQVGTNPQKLAVDPAGKAVYAILTKEASVAVIDTATWKVTRRVSIGTNPSGIFLRPPSA